jgi:hypothetical protein
MASCTPAPTILSVQVKKKVPKNEKEDGMCNNQVSQK